MKILIGLLFISLSLTLTHCGVRDDRDNSGDNDKACAVNRNCSSKSYVKWNSIPRKWNPNVEGKIVSILNLNQIKMNFFEFDKDVRIEYSNTITPGTAMIEIYSVRANNTSSSSLTGIKQTKSGRTLKLSKAGRYNCKINVRKQKIRNLTGACFVRLVVSLSPVSQVEIHNANRILTPRFSVLSKTDFFKNLDDAFLKREKMKWVHELVDSHQALDQNLELSSVEMSDTLDQFLFAKEKLYALKIFHPHVANRKRLKQVIENHFSGPQEKIALDIAGL